MNNSNKSTSPNWSSTTKIVIGLTFAGLLVALLITFRSIIGPLLLAVILAYLLHPLAAWLSNLTRLSWRAAVNIIYLLVLILLIASSTLTGLAVVQQVQALIGVIQRFVNDLPALLEDLSARSYIIGPFTFDLSMFGDLNSSLGNQIIGALQLIVGRAGNLVTRFASGAATTVGWGFFILIVSYFLLADSGKVPDAITYFDIPGYSEDIRRIGRELSRIWNAFLRGQLSIVLMVILCYTLMLSILGVRFFFAIAILAGLARFVPWFGPFVSLLVTALVTLVFQDSNYFGLAPLSYTLLVIGLSILLDQVFDNVVSPRFLGRSLGLHPAAVLVVAIIAANLIGLVGLLLAAPVLATLKLIGRYVLRKMLDLNPWPEPEQKEPAPEVSWLGRLWRRFHIWWRRRKAKTG